MKRFIILFVVLVILWGNAASQEKREGAPKETPVFSWQGYIVDAKSAPAMIKNPDTAMKNAAEYTRATAMKDENQSSGFGIVAEGKWLKFDKSGDKQTIEYLKATKKEKGLLVAITGRMDGERIAVASIKEYLPDNSPEVR